MFCVEPADEDVDGHRAAHQVLGVGPPVLLRRLVLLTLVHAHSNRLRGVGH